MELEYIKLKKKIKTTKICYSAKKKSKLNIVSKQNWKLIKYILNYSAVFCRRKFLLKLRSQNRTGAQILVGSLLKHSVDKVFCVPGESYLAVLDALYDHSHEISLINANHESGASNMAEAYGKLTGKPGIAFVTRGPGACNASIGVQISKQDSTPMILFIGQVESSSYGKESFQEIDYISLFSNVA